MCASQQPGGVARIVALGVMMLLPFGVAVVVFSALRRAGRVATEKDPLEERVSSSARQSSPTAPAPNVSAEPS